MSTHSHDDDRLTFGCQACIERVAKDQQEAELAEQPERPLTIEWRATAVEWGTLVIDARYYDHEDPGTVADRMEREIAKRINRLVDFYGHYDWEWDAVSFGDTEAKAQTA